ncbi:heterogeneous nuclear ribonucleoprotein U-like protein 1 isoform X2 [Periplaneta americana]|uniref:heterogeneous nuclear ribonucleoprotein U-like protein 1 isoform X2 n=1 Tax=Periplaneta americana TaxID=6978 RepID=UPI0037E98581
MLYETNGLDAYIVTIPAQEQEEEEAGGSGSTGKVEDRPQNTSELEEEEEEESKPEPQIKQEREPEAEQHRMEEPALQAVKVEAEVKENVQKEKMETESSTEIKTEKKPEVIEVKDEPEEKMAVDIKDENRDRRDREERRGEKRRRSPSPPRRRSPPRKPDDEPEYDETSVFLSWYDSDLNLVIDKENFSSAAPMFDHGFGYIWAGARATYGFKKGKVFYEVKLMENCDVSHLEDEPSPHVVRVGWSTDDTSMQLGEEPLSYGYGGTGKASTDCKFKDYGKPFQVGDVVGAFLDLDSDAITMTFTVNGEMQGIAYKILRSELQGKALFPHILSKNTKFKCNFGSEECWFPPLEGYAFVGLVPLDQRVSGARRPEKREDCEMIMMCGLPGCGKTTWANEYYAKHLDKKYNILGTNNLIDKMKMMGLPRKRNYAGRWDVLIDKCTKCLVKLLDVASRRRRNYILDQTNVYPSAQRRKMRGFEGFVRRAVVVVPTDEEFKRRCEKREKVEGKDVPDSAVLEMKANFVLPEVGDIFNQVEYTELSEAESRPLVEQYNKEGRDAGYGPAQKRHRNDNRDGRDRSSFRGGFRSRGGPDNRNRSGGGWQSRGGGGGGSWRDRNQPHGGFRSGGAGGGAGGGGGGGGWRGGRGGGRGGDSHGSRGFDRNRPSGGNRNQQSGGKGNWGGYNQGGGGGSGGGGGGGGGGGNWGNAGGGNWGAQGYNQQGWGAQQNYQQQGWKGYGQQANYGQGYPQQGYGQQGYGNGNYANWNQQYYNQAYGAGTQGWGQANADGSYAGYPQQGTWQGYGQGGYNYGNAGPQAQQNK